jgi:hypothetical protein
MSSVITSQFGDKTLAALMGLQKPFGVLQGMMRRAPANSDAVVAGLDEKF